MLWEWIAMISAGLGAAGLVLLARLLFKRLPKWLTPAAAGLGMIVFQVYTEYTWFKHTRSLLPDTAVVVAEQGESAWYKPWTFIVPQTLQFAAIDTAKTLRLPNSAVVQTNLYFFERRMKAQTLPVWIDCTTGKQSNAAPERAASWHLSPYSATLKNALCTH